MARAFHDVMLRRVLAAFVAGMAMLLAASTGHDPGRLTAAEHTSTTTTERRATTTTTIETQPPTATNTTVVDTTTTTIVIPEPVDVSRTIPPAAPVVTVPAAPPPPWAATVTTTAGGYISTNAGCAGGTDAGSLNAYFAQRMGPVMGLDYQHVVALGGNRYAWFFQDVFVDPTGAATRLDQSHFVHNLVLLQTGRCFAMLHRGSSANPASFEPGGGETATKWYWPMGGETHAGRLQMFWVEMVKDPYEPGFGDGLGWHPARTYLATYDATTLRRTGFSAAPNSGVAPIYGYAVASDNEYTYLFGNSFEQNLVREGGFHNGPHSATRMYLARVPLGRLGATPEYRTLDSWSASAGAAVPISSRYWVENPMQPRFFDGQWVSVAKVDGYWGERMIVEVANHPWGPWTTTAFQGIAPRGGDPRMNTYHLHLLPWRSGNGSLIVTVSQNARSWRDAAGRPDRYRPMVFSAGWQVPPPDPVDTSQPATTKTNTAT